MAENRRALLSNVPVVAAAAAALVAAGAWLFVSTSSNDAPVRADAVDPKTKSADALPPLRALPPPGTDLLPPLRTPPPELASKPAAVAKAAPESSVPSAPVTRVPEKAAPEAPSQTAKRADTVTAQPGTEGLRGRYLGTLGDSAGLTLVISAVEAGIVRATASVSGEGPCNDDYPMQGSVRGGKLELRATRMGGRAGDCPLGLSLSVGSGGRLTGSSASGGSVQLTKR
jgi:hypothetical protein